MTLTKSDIPQFISYGEAEAARVDLPCGWYATVRIEPDQDAEPPWEQAEGHGPVSEWRAADSKRAGERVLSQDGSRYRGRARFYDFAEAVRIARKDGWDAPPYAKPGESKRVTAARAAEADFEFLRAWCNDEWQYIGVIVTVYDADGSEVADDALWGVESLGDYWREVAADNINGIIEGLIVPNSTAAAAAV